MQSLWDFALEYYARPKVADTCVVVQDTYGVNVCLLLALCWLDERNLALDEQYLEALQVHIGAWMNDVIKPLRYLRRVTKTPIASLIQDDLQTQIRTHIKQAELLAEKKLLQEIERWLSRFPLVATESPANAKAYLTELGVAATALDLLQHV